MFLRAFFGSEKAFAILLRRIRWRKEVYCPHCGSHDVIEYGWYGVYQKPKYQDCDTYYNDMSMIRNLTFIKRHGIKDFLKQQEDKHRCPECGGTISVHTNTCYNCDIRTSNSKK
ncbi:MAG: hypothetical protein GWN31_03615 [Candidatus Thorarchaeota archaeon]|nr:hypothetical protein [Candidatus Thorarchaeota archaeon]NIW52160.1 hypothetical protein [Candidatus Korarchaeota archaeon]